MTSNSQTSINISDSSVIEHTRNEIDSTPKMKQQVAAKVARNLDELLIELHNCGLSMNAVCREIPLGNPDNRDSKALYNYRNRKGKPPRKYVTKSERYFDIAQAISKIPGHPLTGFSGELLRRVFEGTPYAPARSSAESAAIRVKTILDRSVEKIAKHIDLQDTFRQLAGIRHDTQESFQVKDQYRAAIREKKYTRCIPQLELGYIYEYITDDSGNHIRLETEKDGDYWLGVQRQAYLFIGLDDDSVPRPFLILKTKKGFHAFREHEAIQLNGWQDAPRTWGIMYYGTDNCRFLLGEEIFRRSVKNPWADYDSSNSVWHLVEGDEEYHDVDPLELRLENWNEFEVDRDFEDFRGAANNQQMTKMFLNSNPDFNSKYIEGEDPIGFRPISVDVLERFGRAIGSVGFLKLGGDGGTLNVPSDTPLLFGDDALGMIMGWFTGVATLSLELERDLREVVGDDLENSSLRPPYGWYSADLDQGRWSATDLLWLRTLVFAAKIDSLFQATRPQEKQYEHFIEWLGDD